VGYVRNFSIVGSDSQMLTNDRSNLSDVALRCDVGKEDVGIYQCSASHDGVRLNVNLFGLYNKLTTAHLFSYQLAISSL